MPVADLPYRIEQLTREGQYAYLTRSTDEGKLRVLRNVDLCEGPTLWSSKKLVGYGFYVALRLFATKAMVLTYLGSVELASYCRVTGAPLPQLKDDDFVITESNYLTEEATALTRKEYDLMLHHKEDSLSIEKLEELICKVRGVGSLNSNLDELPKRRGRKKKTEEPETESPAVTTPQPQIKKRKATKLSLRDQFVLVQDTPSRVIDVSKYGESMQHPGGRILDRVKHADRIAKCVVLSDLFPIISDNLQSFERAMAALGPRYADRIAEYKSATASAK